ncbi:helical backbone metal receptor [Ferrimonas senticii]|uniref:helical backbone metal receptor n=1 Tax=Ferrimonas senticii TaxID=394566 RepID=UPI0004258983|nr:helical backbone metal receptor [Ferrimonas senticii]
MKPALRLLPLLGLLPSLVLAAPERIAALSPSSVEMVFALGAGEKIIATVAYADFPEAAKAIKRVGSYNHLDIEQLLLLAPDAVVLSLADTAPQQLQQLALLDVPIIDSGAATMRDLPKKLIELGQALGNETTARQLASEVETKLAALIAAAPTTPVPLFYQVWPEPLTTVSNGWLADMLILCGGDNIFAGSLADYPQVNIEQVIDRQPQLIIKPTHSEFANQEAVSWSQWPEIPAVAKQQIHTIDGDLVHRMGPRTIEGMAQLCHLIKHAAASQLESP